MMKNGCQQALSYNITCIDTGLCRPCFAASYLIEQDGFAAFVDTGTHFSVQRLLDVLMDKQIPRENVLYIILTHVHLDHAGGAGSLIQALPEAKLVVHPRGARHMIDPEALQAGAKAVYGEQEFEKTYGELQPVDEQRILIAEDGFELTINGRKLIFRDTPGHARHHVCIYDELSRGFFTGDTFGLSYRELDSHQGPYILPTTTPVQFDPEAWYASLDILMSYDPQRMYLTHYSMVEDIPVLHADLRNKINLYTEVALQYQNSSKRHEDIKNALMNVALADIAGTDCPLSKHECQALLEIDCDLNAMGLEIWLDRQK